MDFKKAIMDAWQIVTFKEHSIKKIAHEKDVLTNGIIILAIAGIATAIGTFMPLGIIFIPIAYLIGSFIGFGILHLLAKAFGGKATFKQFFAVGMHTSILRWVMIIPVLGWILSMVASIWGFIAMYFVIKNVHDLSPGKSLAVLLIPVLIAMVIAGVIAIFLASAIIGLFTGSGFLSAMRPY